MQFIHLDGDEGARCVDLAFFPSLSFFLSWLSFFGYSHLTGGWSGGQADYVRVPYGEPLHLTERKAKACRPISMHNNPRESLTPNTKAELNLLKLPREEELSDLVSVRGTPSVRVCTARVCAVSSLL